MVDWWEHCRTPVELTKAPYPTGHTISDVEQGIEILAGLVGALIVVGAAIRAAIPLLLLGGPMGLALGLLFYILILTIVALMFYVIGEILDLITDEFDHYQGDRPSDDCQDCIASSDPSDLPEEPEDDCPTDPGSLLNSLNPGDPLFGSFMECIDGSCFEEALDGDFAPNISPMALMLDAAGLTALGMAAFLFWGLTDPTNIGFVVFIARAFGFLSLGVTCAEYGVQSVECLSTLLLFATTAGVGVSAKQLAAGAAVDTISIYRDFFGCW